MSSSLGAIPSVHNLGDVPSGFRSCTAPSTWAVDHLGQADRIKRHGNSSGAFGRRFAPPAASVGIFRDPSARLRIVLPSTLMDFAFDEPVLLAVNLFEILLLIAGGYLLHRWLLGPNSGILKSTRLEAWSISLGDFLIRALFALLGGLSLQFFAQSLEQRFRGNLDADVWLVLYNLAFQLGLLGGLGLGIVYSRVRARTPALPMPGALPESSPKPAAPFQAGAFRSGLMAFLAALPLVALTAWVWTAILRAAGVNTRQQELVDMLTRTDSPMLVASMTALAIVFAPIVEELIFRAGVFRYLRSRIPGIPAYLVSAIFFSALHANAAAFVPLVVFGMVLAFVYERTGRLSICIFAHALFNLHTLAILLVSLKEKAVATLVP